MSPLLYQTIQNFFTPFLSTVVFILFLFATQSLQKDILKRFILASFSVLLLVFADAVQFYCEGLPYVSPVRMWAAIFGYVLRPSIIYYIFMIFLRRKSNRYRRLMSIPLILTAICAFAAFFTEKSFYYTADNVLVRGPLIAMPFIASIFYFVAILIESIRNIRLGDTRETIMILIILGIAAGATYLEAVLRFSGLLSGFCTIGTIMYYLFFMIDNYTHDQLTDAYRRERLFRDFRQVKSGFGLIAFDINDLKDEFIILINSNSKEEIEALEQKIRDSVSHSIYSISIGSVVGEDGEALESAMSRADDIMYAERRAIKGIE